MATATPLNQPVPQPQIHIAQITKKLPVVPIKVGFFGPQGSGKTGSAALLAMALSKHYHHGAPVWVTDTEPGWQFYKKMFAAEGIQLVQRTVPTFKAMLTDLRDAEREGACVWVGDSLTIIWQELMASFKAKNGGFIPIDVWGDIKQLWGEYTTRFLNSQMHCFALGRLGNVMEEVQDERKPGKMNLVKTGTAFKAGGSESFGYEPHLLLELSVERKPKTKQGVKLEGEGRILHRADVLKDRTWALNGKVIRWSDKAGYEVGGYRAVWESLKPHFDAVQETMALVRIQSGTSSTEMISEEGNSEFYRNRQRKDAIFGEISACLDLSFGGSGKEDKQVRIAVTDLIFGVKSKEARESLTLGQLERGLRILHAYEKIAVHDMTSKDTVLIQMHDCIAEYDRGESEEWDIPF
jgi:hypothetical protein